MNLALKIYLLIKYFMGFINPNFLDYFEQMLQDCDSILDLGCGHKSRIRLLKKRKKYTLGVDIYEKYIEMSKKKNLHDDYLVLDILKIDEKKTPKSFDCVLLLDVVEHLEKLEAIKLIRKCEKIAKKKVVISTPNGFLPQYEYHGNIYQIHKSGWNLKIFKKMNFKICGFYGLKYLKGERGHIKFRPFLFWDCFSVISYLFTWIFPQFSFLLLCVKNVE